MKFRKAFLIFALNLIVAINFCVSQCASTLSQIQTEKIISLTKGLPDSTIIHYAMIGENNCFGAILVQDDSASISTVIREPLAFEIGSITKVFTSTLLSMAVTEGKIKLEDNIETVLGFELNCPEDINYTQLSNHTSGLPGLPSNIFEIMGKHQANPYKYYTPELLEVYLKNDVVLTTPPGEQYAYSNLAVGLLGHLLTKIYDQSYEQLVQEKIFTPLDMTNSTVDREKLKIPLATPRQASGARTSNWDFDVLVAAGGIKSSIEELSQFAIHQFEEDNAVNALAHKITFSNDNVNPALGWHIILDEDGTELLFHNGGTGGYTSSMGINKKTKQAVILLSNVSAFHFKMGQIDQLTFELYKTIK